MVTADEFGRSLRGAAAFLNRRPDALARFEISVDAFWRSFGAITLTLPAYVVELALLRSTIGLVGPGRRLFDAPALAILVALGHVLSFLALPVAMVIIARRAGLGGRYVPFVIVTNWLSAFGSVVLALPGTLLLAGLETPDLTMLFTGAFGLVLLFVQWHATRVTLDVGSGFAAFVVGTGLSLSTASGALVQALGGSSSG